MIGPVAAVVLAVAAVGTAGYAAVAVAKKKRRSGARRRRSHAGVPWFKFTGKRRLVKKKSP